MYYIHSQYNLTTVQYKEIPISEDSNDQLACWVSREFNRPPCSLIAFDSCCYFKIVIQKTVARFGHIPKLFFSKGNGNFQNTVHGSSVFHSIFQENFNSFLLLFSYCQTRQSLLLLILLCANLYNFFIFLFFTSRTNYKINTCIVINSNKNHIDYMISW